MNSDKNSKSKDMKQKWAVLCTFSKESAATLQPSLQEQHGAFIQENSLINGKMSDKPSRAADQSRRLELSSAPPDPCQLTNTPYDC